MGKGQKQLQNTATQRSNEQHQVGIEAQRRLVTGSPEFQARKTRVADRRAAINSGDLRNAKDFIGNSAQTAKREEERQTRANLTSTGVAGLASNYADPTRIAMMEKMNKDEFARDSAAQNEENARQYMTETDAMESDVIQTDIGVNNGIMSSAFGTAQSNLQMASQIAASRASIAPAIIGAIAGGAAQAATGSNWFNKKSGGATGQGLSSGRPNASGFA